MGYLLVLATYDCLRRSCERTGNDRIDYLRDTGLDTPY